jgi:RNA polymerase sigma-54 factor
MSIKPRLTTQLHVKQGLSPQLHHSIRLISLPAVELLAQIQQALDENPFLESSQDLDPWDSRVISAAPRETVVSHGDSDYWLESTQAPETLQSHLRWQANLTPFSDEERVLAEMIIESINEEGYLSAPLHEILPATLDNQAYELAHVVLQRIQEFDPPGVGAQDLKECLCIQLRQREPQNSLVRKAMELLLEDVEMMQADPEVFKLIQSLHPKPGLLYGEHPSEILIPDLVVRQEGDRSHEVYLNEALIPSLQLNLHYAHALKISQEKNQGLQDQLNAAKSFIYHVSLRQNTLLSVARCIVKAQQDFFHEGPQALKPLKLEDISEVTALHPSTVSRLTCNKYIHTPRGLFALKYFLCGGVKAEHGTLSSRAVQTLIAQLVVQENKAQPLSDQAIVDKLAENGILLARRTVAKYREALRIPTKSLRKLKQANQE